MVINKNKRNKFLERFNQWVNVLTAQGTVFDKNAAGYFSAGITFLDDTELEALYHENDLARTIVERIVLDSFYKKPKFKVKTSAQEEEQDGMDAYNKVPESIIQKWDFYNLIQKGATWGRLYGCGGLILGVEDGKDFDDRLDFPLQQDSLKWVETFDKQDIVPQTYYSELDATIDPEFDRSKIGKPKTYKLTKTNSNGTGLNFEIHESRLIHFPGASTSKRIRIQNNNCDLSVLHDKYEILRDVGQTWFAGQKLIQDANISVFKLKNLDELISQNKDDALNRMRIVDYAKATSRSILIDAEMEDYSHVGAQNLTGLEPLLEQSFVRLASAARMPVTILMGQSPAGMNATGESDRDNWYKQIQVFQETVLKDRMQFLMTLILQSEGLLSEGGSVEVEFPTLWEESEAEKIGNLKAKADLAEQLIGLGVKTVDDVKDWFE